MSPSSSAVFTPWRLGLGVLAGLLFVWIDTRPNWDDTGILVFGLLFASALLCAVGTRPFWVAGLAMGAFIPLVEGLVRHNWGSLLALLPPLVGSYVGSVIYQVARSRSS